MSPQEQKQPEIVRWENFSNWIHAICVVTFDLELGQAMELAYPSPCALTERERASVCYLAFPDSNSGLMGNVQFHFRIRMCPESHPRILPQGLADYDQTCPAAVKIDPGYLYGYVYFRQVKDKTLKRGYFQKSVVLLSRLPLVSLFNQVLDIIAPEYFDCGEASLEAACHDIDQWSVPISGQTLCLPIMGTLIKVRVPSGLDKPSCAVTQPAITEESSPSIIIPSPHEIQAFPVMAPVLPYANLLWELVLTAEPLVVMATNPATAANMVQTLVSLISPLKYSGDYRPFFTIHDSEFREYTTRTCAPPNLILGVTNPFFAKTLQHWPHIIRLGEDARGFQKSKLSKSRTLKVVEHKPGVYTKFKPHLQPDKSLVKRLLKGAQTHRPVEAQSALLRRHLLELTQSFMIPLERYMASLMPLRRKVSPYKATPTMRPFSTEEFLGTLESSGPQLTTGIKGDWEGLYRKFFRTDNFKSWFNTRQEDVRQKLAVLHMEAVAETDLNEWANDRCEVEVVDMVLRLRSQLSMVDALNSVRIETKEKLNNQMEKILSTLPEDLKMVLNNSRKNEIDCM